MKLLRTFTLAAVAVLVMAVAPAEAKRHHRGGSCDGIHRCRCGSTQAAFFGLPRMYRGFNLWLASDWPRAFRRTTAHSGAVGYQPGHVFRYDHATTPGRAVVHDDAGTYERNVRGAIYVDPNGNGAVASRSSGEQHARWNAL